MILLQEKNLYKSMMSQWPRLEHKFKAAKAAYDTINLYKRRIPNIEIGDQFFANGGLLDLELSGNSEEYQAHYSNKEPADLVARTLDIYYNSLINRSIIVPDGIELFDFRHAGIRQLLTVTRDNFDLLMSSIKQIVRFIRKNEREFDAVRISNFNLKSNSTVMISPASNSFAAIIDAIRSDDPEEVSRLVQQR